MSKYAVLWKYLKDNQKERYILTFEELKKILGFDIDYSFFSYRYEIKEFGYKISTLSLREQHIVFQKI